MKFRKILVASSLMVGLIGAYKLLPVISNEYQVRVPRVIEKYALTRNPEDINKHTLVYNTHPKVDSKFGKSWLEVTCTDGDGITSVGNWEILLTINGTPHHYLDGWAYNKDRLVKESNEMIKVVIPDLPKDSKSWFKDKAQDLVDTVNLGYNVFFSYNDGNGLLERVNHEILLQ